MNLPRIQRIVWIPLQRQHLIASLLCACCMIVLGSLGFAGFPAFKSYADIQANIRSLITFDLLLFAANYVFLLRQALPSYIRTRTAVIPTLLSLIVLSAVSLGITYWIGPATKTQQIANNAKDGGSTSTAVQSVANNTTDHLLQGLLRAILVAQGGLTAVILASGLWKNDEEAAAVLAKSLAKVREVRERLLKGLKSIEEARQTKLALMFHLESTVEWITKNQYLAELAPADQLAQLKTDCTEALRATEGLDVAEFCRDDIKQWIERWIDPITLFA